MEDKMDLMTKIFLSNAVLWLSAYVFSGRNKGMLIDYYWKLLTILSIPAEIIYLIWR